MTQFFDDNTTTPAFADAHAVPTRHEQIRAKRDVTRFDNDPVSHVVTKVIPRTSEILLARLDKESDAYYPIAAADRDLVEKLHTELAYILVLADDHRHQFTLAGGAPTKKCPEDIINLMSDLEKKAPLLLDSENLLSIVHTLEFRKIATKIISTVHGRLQPSQSGWGLLSTR